MKTFIFALLLFFAGCSTLDQWKSRVIYQLLTDRFALNYSSDMPCENLNNYCGGSFKGLISNLSYIEDMGFDAIWISPVTENTEKGYHGYFPKNFYEINKHFGTEQDLKNLVSECHNKNILLMLDVVANNIGPVGNDYSEIAPFNNTDDYHNYCEIDEDAIKHHIPWVLENCRRSSLPDLNHEKPEVEQKLLSWITNLVGKYQVDGLRVDSAINVPKWFWKKFSKAAGVFTLGEVKSPRADITKGYVGPLDSTLNYVLFEEMRDVFLGEKPMTELRKKIEESFNTFGNQIYSTGLFFDNHDNERFLGRKKCNLCFRSIMTFIFFFPGIPIFYYGDEMLFSGKEIPKNREILWPYAKVNTGFYRAVKLLLDVRKKEKVWEYPYVELYSSKNALVFMRGNVIAAFSNDNERYQVITEISVPFPFDTILRDTFTRQDIRVMEQGKIQVSLGPHEVRLFVAHVTQPANAEK